MSKRKPRTPQDTFVRLDHALLSTMAWLYLSPAAMKLLLALWTRYTGQNNGQIPFGVREAMSLLGCSGPKARQAFNELLDKGFVRVARDSDFRTKRIAREFTITALPLGDEPATRDFEQWTPEQSADRNLDHRQTHEP